MICSGGARSSTPIHGGARSSFVPHLRDQSSNRLPEDLFACHINIPGEPDAVSHRLAVYYFWSTLSVRLYQFYILMQTFSIVRLSLDRILQW
jgi:hypothetical protein